MKKIFLIGLVSFYSYSAHSFSLVEFIKEKIDQIRGVEKKPEIVADIPMPPILPISADAKAIINTATTPDKVDKMTPEQKTKMNISYIAELYLATVLIDPTSEELNQWMNVLEQGASREGVYRGVINHVKYIAYEEKQELVATKPQAEFMVAIAQKYFNKTYKLENVETFNMFSLKKALVEDLLNEADALSQNTTRPDDIYAWYANLSSELAVKAPNALKNTLRKNADKKIHFDWAKAVSSQMMKSEIILKTLHVFNSLKV